MPSAATVWDVAIVGSGASGGRMALDLARAGRSVLVLEAGADHPGHSYPADELTGSASLYWNGGSEPMAGARIGLLRGKAAGGSTVVNSALLDRFDARVWDRWRTGTGVPHFTVSAADEDYAAVEAGMQSAPIPREAWNAAACLLAGALERQGHPVKQLVRADAQCAADGMDCLPCLFGCRRGRKQSSAVTTLAQARALGAQLQCGTEVDRLRLDGATPLLQGRGPEGEPVQVRARHVVVAAGAVGSTALLLRSGLGRRVPHLGRGFACHPSLIAIGRMDHCVDSHRGAYTAIASHGEALRAQGLKLEHVAVPPIGTAFLVPGIGRAHTEALQDYRRLLFLELAIQDDTAGSLQLGWGGGVRIHKPLTAADQGRLARGAALLDAVLREAGAREVWQAGELYGLHPMGGCGIGADPERSVVGPDFRMHQDRRVTIADASVFPAAPGYNPSLTIMALSHRAARALLADA